MPELPDLIYITDYLKEHITGKTITSVEIKNSLVIRNGLEGGDLSQLEGQKFLAITHRGHFLNFPLSGGIEIIINLMLAGQLKHGGKKDKGLKKVCFLLNLDDGSRLIYGDTKLMGKAYFIKQGHYDIIPGYTEQGIDILGNEFTYDAFEKLVNKNRQQVRVLLMDKTKISAVGNAYADEILFRAGLHPKTTCTRLKGEEIQRLYNSIKEVMEWGREEVRKAGEPIEVKVRGHMRVRNRKDEPCPVCGTIIRRASVLGYDTFFCPKCQPPTTNQLIVWEK